MPKLPHARFTGTRGPATESAQEAAMHRKPFNPTKRYLVNTNPHTLSALPAHRQLWAESLDEVNAGLAWGAQKRILLRWVRETMMARCTQREQQCIIGHFFEGMTYEAIAQRTGTSRSSCCHAAKRGIKRLRAAAEEQGLKPKLPYRLRR
jgi:DNA-directed RNA polymerase specialized sigma24 family protein